MARFSGVDMYALSRVSPRWAENKASSKDKEAAAVETVGIGLTFFFFLVHEQRSEQAARHLPLPSASPLVKKRLFW